jgi:threonine synthase
MVAARALEGERGETVILTATSGDTGKAALEGFHDVAGTRIFVFFPHGGVSPVQQLQMLTQQGANVQVCAVRGNFDDCQTAVKETFAALRQDAAFTASGYRLSSANSINIGRLAPQLVYYFIAYAGLIERGRIRLGDPVDYVVPTGNFGDILAGWMAKALGLPVGKLICASNANNVLTDFFASGCYNKKRAFFKTSSPSMDILVSSNLERLLFYVSGGDTALVADAMRRLNEEGAYTLPAELMEEIRRDFAAYCADEADTRAEIGRLWREQRYLCDPHTAVALHAARLYREEHGKGAPQVVLSTASPYKFPAAVLAAIGGDTSGDEFAQMETLLTMTGVPIPPNLAGLKDRAVRFEDVIDAADMADYICAKLGVVR